MLDHSTGDPRTSGMQARVQLLDSFTVLGRWAWGPCEAADVRGGYAYIGNGMTFQVLDLSDPARPTVAGEYFADGYIYDIKIRDTLAFVCTGPGLHILNTSDPNSPARIGYLAMGGIPFRVVPTDSFAYVTTMSSGVLWVLDITNPMNPTRRGVTYVFGEFPSALAVRNGYAYVGTIEFGALVVVDATDPDSLSTNLVLEGTTVLSAALRDTFLYLGTNGTLKVCSIADPSIPRFLGEVQTGDYIYGVAVRDSHVYVSCRDSGLFSIDVSNPVQPQIIARMQKRLPSSKGNITAVSSELAIAAYYNGAVVASASQPDSLAETSFVPTGGYANNVRIKGNYAFIASGLSGLWIVDVSNAQQPRAVSNVNTGSYTADVLVDDTVAYIVNWSQSTDDTCRGVWIINTSDIAQPRVVAHYVGIVRDGGYPYHENSLAKMGNLLFVTQVRTIGNDSIYEVIDVADHQQPVRVGVLRGSYSPYYSAVKDSFAYLASPDSGMRVVDLRDPFDPREVAGTLNSSFGITVRDSLAFNMAGGMMHVINVSSPFVPLLIGSTGQIYSGATSFRLTTQDNLVYWAEGDLGVVDVSNPQNPFQRGTFFGNYDGKGVAVLGDTVYFTALWQGMWLLRHNILTSVSENEAKSLPPHFELHQNYPNPFNAQTIIQFSLPRKSEVKLAIFNILGQELSTLHQAAVEAGTHTIVYDASALPSGVYFCRLVAEKIALTKKMIVLR